MKELIETLRMYNAIKDTEKDNPDIFKTRIVPAQKPEYENSDFINTLHPSIAKALETIGVNDLYKHQADAIRYAIDGKDVVLESPTASGKTLAFTIPMVNMILNNRDSHIMLIYPMKALANDQRRQITDFLDYFKYQHIESWTFDGDTSQEHRHLLKSHPPHIILTNPENLHYSFLGWSNQWEEFLKKIKFIVIDEIHEYRGFFGTNFALLLRRFLLKLSKLGANPQLFLCTATCKNPKEHAKRLTGRNVELVSAKNHLRPKRNFIFINPKHIPDFNFREIFQYRIANAALASLSMNFSTIVFCPSRKFAENIYKIARRESITRNLDSDTIVPYKSGIIAEKRREIEKGLRTGKYKLVFTTNALELGIDIGRLDVCILAGFPDNIMSAWQRIGRVGRNWNSVSNVIFFAMNNAFDEFYASNIDAFLDKPLDEITIGLDNEEIIAKHIKYLLHESNRELFYKHKTMLGNVFYNNAMKALQDSRPLRGSKGPSYMHLNLRGTSGSIYKLIYKGNEIGTISESQAFREAFIGAIYNHFGKSYIVISHGGNEINLDDAEPFQYTDPLFYTAVQNSDILKGFRYENISIYYGKLTIYENFSGYKIIDERNGSIIDEIKSDISRHKNAHAFWLKLENSNNFENATNGLSALQHMIRVGSTFIIPSDRHDTNTYSNRNSFEIYLYENYPGGIGISEKAFDIFRDIIKQGIKISEDCSCIDGCPSCIFPPRFKKADGLSKIAGIKLAYEVLDETESRPLEIFDPHSFGWKKYFSNQ